MKDKSSLEKEIPEIREPEGVSSEKVNSNDNLEGKKLFSDDKIRIRELEKDLSQKESEIIFFKEKITNDQEIILDVIEEKKLLKKQIKDFQLKELDLKLNNYMELQRNHHKVEHRLFVTKNHLEDAHEELEFREKIIAELENRGLRDYILGRFPNSYQEYKKRDR